MTEIWADEQQFEYWRRVEVAVCEAWAERGVIPVDALPAIRAATFDLRRIAEIEAETHHDVIAFVRNMAETAGPEGRFIHYGLTSSDVVDTANALRLATATDLLMSDVQQLERAVTSVTLEHRLTPFVGRRDANNGDPTTLGSKLAGWVAILRRNWERLVGARREIAVGQISGAVGTHANVPACVEEIVCKRLGLEVEPVSTQILQRDRHAAYLGTLAVIAATIEMMANEIRILQRAEVADPYLASQQGTSSTRPERIPEAADTLCGLARIVRAAVIPALESVALWHERDISHSSVERIVLPDATITLDYMLRLFTNILDKLMNFPDRTCS
jgi:adenylosuccinate lyase